MLRRLLHTMVATPWVYETVQRAVGLAVVQRRVAEQVEPLKNADRVLDLGGGTGLSRSYWSAQTRYTCLDLDPVKLRGYRARFRHGFAVLGDATLAPFASSSMDVVLCTAVSHHLADAALHALLAETARVLKPGGSLVFWDAVWKPLRLPGRLLWNLDRGAFPRPAEALRLAISRNCRIRHWQHIPLLHEYVVCIAGKD